MTYTISKDFSFSASHHLEGLEAGHPCARVHGHNYVVRVELSTAELDHAGMVLDYGRLAPFGQWLASHVDHRHLNDVVPVNPTAENLASYFARSVRPRCPVPLHVRVRVGVSETPKTWAWAAL